MESNVASAHNQHGMERERIKLLGETNCSELAARLALERGAFITRDRVIQDLYPGIEPDAARNRLRVALSRLRHRDQLRVEANLLALEVPSDYSEFLVLATEADEEPDPGNELRLRRQLRSELSKELLDSCKWPWAETFSSEHALLRAEYLAKDAELCIDRELWEEAMTVASMGLAIVPLDEGFWEIKLRALKRLGQLRAGLREWDAVRSEPEAQWSEPLLEQVSAMRSMTDEPPVFSEVEKELLVATLSEMMDREPQAMLNVLASDSFRPFVIAQPRPTLKLLRDVLKECPEASSVRERCEVRVITALALLHQHQEIVDVTPKFLGNDPQPNRRRIALLNMSNSLFRLGRTDEAFEAIEGAIQIAEETGWTYDAWQCRGQKATFLMLEGQLEPAGALLTDALDYLQAHPDPLAKHDELSLAANLGILRLLEGDMELGISLLTSVLKDARSRKFERVVGVAASWLGLAHSQASDSAAARKSLIEGLRAALRSEAPEVISDSTILAAEALVRLGRQDARRLLASCFDEAKQQGYRVPPIHVNISAEFGIDLEAGTYTGDALVREVVQGVRDLPRSSKT